MAYTYDDFMKRATEYGLMDKFSDYDLRLAKENPEAGISILNYKRDFTNAATAEARALANAGAEKIRKDYGNYTGGQDGSRFYLDEPEPAGYQAEEQPTYSDPYKDQIQAALEKVTGAGSYGGYDPASDPEYGATKKQYLREGDRATQNAVAQAAALTGGMPSTAAITAGTQAGDYYATQFTDRFGELADKDYQKWIDQQGLSRDSLETLLGVSNNDYGRYQDDLSQYNTNRNFDWSQFLENLYFNREGEAADQDQSNYRAEMTLDEAIAYAQQTGDNSYLLKLLQRSLQQNA